MAPNDPLDNVFIRFKNHMDDNISRGFQTLFGSFINMGNDNVVNADDVVSWAVSSPYSPVNLQSLKQPRPLGAPPGTQFTFRDAFEDLLEVQSGHGLESLRMRLHDQYLEHIKLETRGTSVESWITGLARRGLLPAYFPLAPGVEYELSKKYWKHHSLQGLAFRRPDVSWSAGTILPELALSLQDEEDEEDDESEYNTSDDRRLSTRLPRTELDLYNFFENVFLRGEPEQTNDVRGDQQQPTQSQPPTPEYTSSDDVEGPAVNVTRTTETVGNYKVEEEVREYEDDNGGMVIEKTVRTYNADGKLVAINEEMSRSSSRSWSKQLQFGWTTGGGSGDTKPATTSNEPDSSAGSRPERKPTGWFWSK